MFNQRRKIHIRQFSLSVGQQHNYGCDFVRLCDRLCHIVLHRVQHHYIGCAPQKLTFLFWIFWISGWYNFFPSREHLSIDQSPLMRRTTAVDKCGRVVFFIYCGHVCSHKPNPLESALGANNTRPYVEITESVWL